jgi:hypothetical protein
MVIMKSSNRRREFVKRAVYVAPAILTLAATPAYAKAGSDKRAAEESQNPTKPKKRDQD